MISADPPQLSKRDRQGKIESEVGFDLIRDRERSAIHWQRQAPFYYGKKFQDLDADKAIGQHQVFTDLALDTADDLTSLLHTVHDQVIAQGNARSQTFEQGIVILSKVAEIQISRIPETASRNGAREHRLACPGNTIARLETYPRHLEMARFEAEGMLDEWRGDDQIFRRDPDGCGSLVEYKFGVTRFDIDKLKAEVTMIDYVVMAIESGLAGMRETRE